jgi:hypothetical protein
VEVLIDDTPEAAIISGFDPVRREVARTALERLVSPIHHHLQRKGLEVLNESIRASKVGFIRLGYFGYLQLALLFLMFFLYVGFRIYYAHKYGEWETDEEQD